MTTGGNMKNGTDQTSLALPQQTGNSLDKVIATLASNKDFNVEDMTELFKLQERVTQRQAIIEFNESMARLSGKLPRIARRGKTDKAAYATYEDIDREIRPLLAEEGFSLSFDTALSGDRILIITGYLKHVGGHVEQASIPLVLDTSGSKNQTQAYGSTLSYGKRYTACMLLNIVTEKEDDDASMVNITPINGQQVEAINDLLTRTKADKAKFLEYMGVNSVEMIVQRDYNRAVTALRAKLAGVK